MKLQEELEEKRELLYRLISIEGNLTNIRIISCSQELDILINKYSESIKER